MPQLNQTHGLEGMTFLPLIPQAKRANEDNLFLLGHALTGDIYKFRIPAVRRRLLRGASDAFLLTRLRRVAQVSASAATFVGKFATWTGNRMTDMDYHVATKTLYARSARAARLHEP